MLSDRARDGEQDARRSVRDFFAVSISFLFYHGVVYGGSLT